MLFVPIVCLTQKLLSCSILLIIKKFRRAVPYNYKVTRVSSSGVPLFNCPLYLYLSLKKKPDLDPVDNICSFCISEEQFPHLVDVSRCDYAGV
jgi:hypothetical protein